MAKIFVLLFLFFATSDDALAMVTDCTEAYLAPNKCEQIKCDENYLSYIGTWSGPMESLVDSGPLPVYRKYHNEIKYDPADCLRNLENGETFIIGRQTDSYAPFLDKPASIEQKLLITGKDKNEKPFLRTIDFNNKKIESFNLVRKNETAVLSIWNLEGVQDGLPYIVETIDAKDWTVKDPTTEHRRNVTVTLEAGGFKRVLVRGYHTKH